MIQGRKGASDGHRFLTRRTKNPPSRQSSFYEAKESHKTNLHQACLEHFRGGKQKLADNAIFS
jgi:hypothetical protein